METQSEACTRGVRVMVRAVYSAARSAPAEGLWFFVYRVTLRNEGAETVTLLGRHWVITDGNERVEEVRGAGVVGEQPVLAPGQVFEYSSGCPLGTPVGAMRGSYQMVAADGTRFDATIAPFELIEPRSIH